MRGEITRLRGSLLGATALPTEAQHRTLQRLERDLTKTVADVNDALSKATELMKELSEGGFYPSLPKPVSP